MRVLVVLSLLAIAMIFAGCGESEEPVVDTASDVAAETTDVEEVVEVIEEVAVNGQLPEPWPEDFLLPEGLVVVMEAANQDGYPLIEAQFSEDAEPMAILDVYNYFIHLTANTDWTAPQLEQNESSLTSTSFHLDLMHPEHLYIIIDGSIDAETGILTVEFVWVS